MKASKILGLPSAGVLLYSGPDNQNVEKVTTALRKVWKLLLWTAAIFLAPAVLIALWYFVSGGRH